MRSTKFYRAQTPDLKIANYLPNWGILSGKMPTSLFTSVKKEIREIEKNFKKSQFFGHNLAGNIKREYQLKKNHKSIEQFMFETSREYNDAFDYMCHVKVGNADVPMIIDKAWVNFQDKHEFNPAHTHSGIYSFVGFIKIPYSTDDLKKSPGAKSNNPCAGGLSFMYSNMLGGSMDYTFQATKEDEGLFFFFPAKLQHLVYPFYSSNGYRITISANLVLKLK